MTLETPSFLRSTITQAFECVSVLASAVQIPAYAVTIETIKH